MSPPISPVSSVSAPTSLGRPENGPNSLSSEASQLTPVSVENTPATVDGRPEELIAAVSAFASDDVDRREDESEHNPAGKGTKEKTKNKKVERKSNRYHDKTKAKVHLGACVTGGIAMGVLAGPIGLVFAAVYINAMCMTMYGGSEFFTGDKKEDKKPDQEPPQAETPPHSGPSPEHLGPAPTPDAESESTTDGDSDEGKKYYNKVNSDNLTFAPVTNIGDNYTINGNVYLYPGAEHPPTAEAGDVSTDAAEPAPQQGEQSPTSEASNDIHVTNVVNVSPQSVEEHDGMSSEVLETLNHPSDDSQLFHVTFSDGMRAYLRTDPDLVSAVVTPSASDSEVPSTPTGMLGWVWDETSQRWEETVKQTPVQTTEGPIKLSNYRNTPESSVDAGRASSQASSASADVHQAAETTPPPPKGRTNDPQRVDARGEQGSRAGMDSQDGPSTPTGMLGWVWEETSQRWVETVKQTPVQTTEGPIKLSNYRNPPKSSVDAGRASSQASSASADVHQAAETTPPPPKGRTNDPQRVDAQGEQGSRAGMDSQDGPSTPTGMLGGVRDKTSQRSVETVKQTPVQTTEVPIKPSNYRNTPKSSVDVGRASSQASSASADVHQAAETTPPSPKGRTKDPQRVDARGEQGARAGMDSQDGPSTPTGMLGWGWEKTSQRWVETVKQTPVQTTEGPIKLSNYRNPPKSSVDVGRASSQASSASADVHQAAETTPPPPKGRTKDPQRVDARGEQGSRAGMDSQDGPSTPTGMLGGVRDKTSQRWVETVKQTPVQTTEVPIKPSNYRNPPKSSVDVGQASSQASSASADVHQAAETTPPPPKGRTNDPQRVIFSADQERAVRDNARLVQAAETDTLSMNDSTAETVQQTQIAVDAKKAISGWVAEKGLDGTVRWVNLNRSTPVILSVGSSISGAARNYTKGVFANLKDLDKSRLGHLAAMQGSLSKSQYTGFNVFNGQASWPVNRQNLSYVAS
ncbi:hypothetical protein ACFFUP_04345 [Vibrio ostreicida]|uniref:Uncharacterized protein n=2 Tax=Vibrio ostreicida TaxID=526588 RepID=A0ABT8BXZ8_9VIBR|nr:hypothetical protein [Vibrio ostreicida]MDN3612030.1 hypothetical protein [Vibrio ostreicida]NPD08797.1 hypothetical protein [Vibrio ostreicida]